MKYIKCNEAIELCLAVYSLISEVKWNNLQWKEDIGIPISEIDNTLIKCIEDPDSIICPHKDTFLVIHENIRYLVMVYIDSEHKLQCTIADTDTQRNYVQLEIKNNIREATYRFIIDKDLDMWNKSKQQIIENFGLSSDSRLTLFIE